MQKFLLFFSVILVLFSCKQTTTNKNQNSNKDTSSVAEEEVTPDIKKLRQEYVLDYNKSTEFESFHKGRSDERLKVLGKYYCLFDNAIVVPGKYNFDDTTKSFRTHNFAEDIVIISNGDTIIKRTITKKDFLDKLPQSLKDYAVIFEPKFDGYNSADDVFDFHFSVSIPLTDVGQLMSLSLKRNGQITDNKAE
ncbi:hypothetical protein BH10BAC2_BH10BAC2_31030 [soil metagenome]